MSSEAPSTSSSHTPTRRPYHGSCHCGFTQYIAFLTLPPTKLDIHSRPSESTRLRKCNCSTCHKMDFFHARLMNAPEDFMLLSPTDPFTELADYTCFDAKIHWFFCKTCGVRCFAFCGKSEVVDVDVDKVTGASGEGSAGGDGGGARKAWRPSKEGWREGGMRQAWRPKKDDFEEEVGKGCYLSVNAMTLEPGQEGLDLREWVEKNWVCYLDTKDEKEEDRYGRPQLGGAY